MGSNQSHGTRLRGCAKTASAKTVRRWRWGCTRHLRGIYLPRAGASRAALATGTLAALYELPRIPVMRSSRFLVAPQLSHCLLSYLRCGRRQVLGCREGAKLNDLRPCEPVQLPSIAVCRLLCRARAYRSGLSGKCSWEMLLAFRPRKYYTALRRKAVKLSISMPWPFGSGPKICISTLLMPPRASP